MSFVLIASKAVSRTAKFASGCFYVWALSALAALWFFPDRNDAVIFLMTWSVAYHMLIWRKFARELERHKNSST